jgi:hypothetical protein
MINHIDKKEKQLKKCKKLLKNIDMNSRPTHHGVEWAKLIINEHQNMKENEANWAELMEFQQALKILADSGEQYYFYL